MFDDESRAGFKAVSSLLWRTTASSTSVAAAASPPSARALGVRGRRVDLTFERVVFLPLRAREMGLASIRVLCAGDTRPLPFPAASFYQVLNGVLECSASAEGQRPVRTGQLEFLRELAFLVLRPDGHLYIGIENRYGYRYFLGAPEDHTGVKYAAPVPRGLTRSVPACRRRPVPDVHLWLPRNEKAAR